MYRPYFDIAPGDIVLYQDRTYPGHDMRFLPLIPFIRAHPQDWFLVSDTDDVVYQGPVEPPSEGFAIVSPEGITFGEAPYWKRLLIGPYEGLRSFPVFNAGCYLARGRELIEIWRRMRERSWEVPEPVDMLELNLYLSERESGYKAGYEEFLCLYNRKDESDWDGERLVSKKTGNPYSVVHANGSTRHIMDALYGE